MHFIHNYMEALGWALVHFLWQGTAVAMVLGLVLHGLQQRSARASHALSGLALLLMLGVFVGTLFVVWERPLAVVAPVNWSNETDRTHGTYTTNPEPSAITETAPLVIPQTPIVSAPVADAAPLPSPMSVPFSEKVRPYLPWAVGIWAVGVLCFALRFLVALLAVRCWKRSGNDDVNAEWKQRFSKLCATLEMTRPVKLLTSATIAVPMVIGWIKPIVLVPGGLFTGLPSAQLEAILAHELPHIRRHDYLINLFQHVMETLFFYHPAVWWISRKMREEREHCCDDLAASACGGALGYAKALTALEELRGSPPALGISASGGSLLARIRRIMGLPAERSRSWPAGLFAALAVAIIIPFAIAKEDVRPALQDKEQTIESAEPRLVQTYKEPGTFSLTKDISLRILEFPLGKSKDQSYTGVSAQFVWKDNRFPPTGVTPKLIGGKTAMHMGRNVTFAWQEGEPSVWLINGYNVQQFDMTASGEVQTVPAQRWDEWKNQAMMPNKIWEAAKNYRHDQDLDPPPMDHSIMLIHWPVIEQAVPKSKILEFTSGGEILLDKQTMTRAELEDYISSKGKAEGAFHTLITHPEMSLDLLGPIVSKLEIEKVKFGVLAVPRPQKEPNSERGGTPAELKAAYRKYELTKQLKIIQGKLAQTQQRQQHLERLQRNDPSKPNSNRLEQLQEQIDELTNQAKKLETESAAIKLEFPVETLEEYKAFARAKAEREGKPLPSEESPQPRAIMPAPAGTNTNSDPFASPPPPTPETTKDQSKANPNASQDPASAKADGRDAQATNATSPVNIAREAGDYSVADGIKLHIIQIASDHGVQNRAVIKWSDRDEKVLHEHSFNLAHGTIVDPILWQTGNPVFWVVYGNMLRKFDYTNPQTARESSDSNTAVSGGMLGGPAEIRALQEEIRKRQTNDVPEICRLSMQGIRKYSDIMDQGWTVDYYDPKSKSGRPRDNVIIFGLDHLSSGAGGPNAGPWIYFLPEADHFHIKVNTDPFGSREVIYGPITGHPVDVLHLSDWLKKSPIYRDAQKAGWMTEKLLISSDEKFARLGMEWISQFPAPTFPRQYQSLVDALQTNLKRNPPAAFATSLQESLDGLNAKAAAVVAAWDQKRAVLPGSAYTQGKPFPSPQDLKITWGKPAANGLRLGFSGVDEKTHLKTGDILKLHIYVRNDGLLSVRFATSTANNFLDESFIDVEGNQHRSNWPGLCHMGVFWPLRYSLEPGHFVQVGEESLLLFQQEQAGIMEPKTAGKFFRIPKQGEYRLLVEARFDEDDLAAEDGRVINVAPKGQWRGRLDASLNSLEITGVSTGVPPASPSAPATEPTPDSTKGQPTPDTSISPNPASAKADGRDAHATAWSATGRVTDAEGHPMPNVDIWVATGMGSLKSQGPVKTDADGRYRAEFLPGFTTNKDSPGLQVANITAHKSGFTEKNLSRHGAGSMAAREVPADALKNYPNGADGLSLPGRPRTVDFVMQPAVTIKGNLQGSGKFSLRTPTEVRKNPEDLGTMIQMISPLKGWRVWLKGNHLPPGASALSVATTDAEGNFIMEDVPAGYNWQFQCESNVPHNQEPLSRVFRTSELIQGVARLQLSEKQDEVFIIQTALLPDSAYTKGVKITENQPVIQWSKFERDGLRLGFFGMISDKLKLGDVVKFDIYLRNDSQTPVKLSRNTVDQDDWQLWAVDNTKRRTPVIVPFETSWIVTQRFLLKPGEMVKWDSAEFKIKFPAVSEPQDGLNPGTWAAQPGKHTLELLCRIRPQDFADPQKHKNLPVLGEWKGSLSQAIPVIVHEKEKAKSDD